jgi:hypothetical protein
MKITKGTPLAMDLFAELKKSGDLVDVYAEDFFERQPSYDQDPSAPFTKEGIEGVNELESDSDEDTKPKNHLIFIFIDEYKKDILIKLKTVYPPLIKFFEKGHLPDFLLL